MTYNEGGDAKNHSYIHDWLTDPIIGMYDDFGVYPHPPVWTPLALELMEEWADTDFEPIINHIRILCNNDDNVAGYAIKWLAQMVQYPAMKTNIPTFQSEPGGGNNKFLGILRFVFGERKVFETTRPERDVWGAFKRIV